MSLNAKDTSNQDDSSPKDSSSDEGQPSLESPPSMPMEEPAEGGKETQRKSKPPSPQYQKFLDDLEKITDPDAKLQFVMDFMEASLAQTGTPHFKTFWDARALSLVLFREAVNPMLRANLWVRYEELAKEARRLKEVMEEQSAFAVEQFEIAIAALEAEIAAFDEQLQKISAPIFEVSGKLLSKGLAYYEQLQRQLNLLNAQASRINALRKELVRTEMRVRQKNRFFQRLSAAGDNVFPKRKQLIKEISLTFDADVNAFIAANFSDDHFHTSLFNLREEIKLLQGMAKQLTLNTHAFNHTRMQLSACWDKIKGEEKERRKERAQQRVVYRQNLEDGLKRLEEFTLAYGNQQFATLEEAAKTLEALVSHLRTLELGKEEETQLKAAVHEARKPIKERQDAEEQQRQQQTVERDKQRRQKIAEIRKRLVELHDNVRTLELESVTSQRDQLAAELEELQLGKADKQEFERLFKGLRDLIADKKDEALLALSEDDRQSLQQLKEVLKQKQERRREIKEQIAQFRKAGGTSGLDIGQAMEMEEQVTAERERLEKINQSIQELEAKIQALQRH